jgi:hypothetical protein
MSQGHSLNAFFLALTREASTSRAAPRTDAPVGACGLAVAPRSSRLSASPVRLIVFMLSVVFKSKHYVSGYM